MPSKKKKYNARFPAGRIKKIMQSDEEIGKVAQAVPVIISRTLELFVESLLAKTLKITNSRNARTLSTSHMKQCIMSENRFDFLRELVKNIPDISVAEEAANYNEDDVRSSPELDQYPDNNDTPYDLSMPSTSTQASRASSALSNGCDSKTSLRSHNSRNGEGVAAVVGSHAMDLRGHADERSRAHLKRELGGSVIMRSVDGVPSKLSRTDSMSLRSDAPAVYCPRQRLKHQSQSVPGNSNATTTSNNNNYNNRTPPKQKIVGLKEGSPQPPVHRQHNAINAPIVTYDFSNKPVVKIDYSILSADAKQAPVGPLSAPAEIDLSSSSKQHASAFHFSADPVISIDLSNIVAEAAMKAAAATTPAARAPTVNVTMGASPAIAMPKFQTTSSTTTHPKASLAAPLRSNSCSSSSGSSTGVPTSKNNTFYFELDEDYDNI